MEVINFLLFHSLSPFTLQTIFIATSSFALQSHEILGLILELFLWKLMAVSRPIHSGLTISFTRNISLCLLRFFFKFLWSILGFLRPLALKVIQILACFAVGGWGWEQTPTASCLLAASSCSTTSRESVPLWHSFTQFLLCESLYVW